MKNAIVGNSISLQRNIREDNIKMDLGEINRD